MRRKLIRKRQGGPVGVITQLEIKKKIASVKKAKEEAIYHAGMAGSMHPAYSADAFKYDYAVEVLEELLNG